MSRRSGSSPIEDLLELVALMPWWVGVALAIASYLLLHGWAVEPVTVTLQPGQAGSMVTQTLRHTLAGIGQYLLPLACLAGAAVSAGRRRERRRLVAGVGQSRSAAVLDGMSWQQFEKLVGESFRQQGYRVAETGGGGADGGVDLVLIKGTDKHFVQCKQWRALKVGVDVVRELYGVMAARGATGGFVVTSGRFTGDAMAFAQGRNIQLIDGTTLHALIRRAQSATSASGAQAAPVAGPANRAPAPVEATESGAPACPVCSRPMHKRTSKRGASAGSAFWGCKGYPSCRGTRPLA
jgi:restriction system protein